MKSKAKPKTPLRECKVTFGGLSISYRDTRSLLKIRRDVWEDLMAFSQHLNEQIDEDGDGDEDEPGIISKKKKIRFDMMYQ